jgi:hypothetical protein
MKKYFIFLFLTFLLVFPFCKKCVKYEYGKVVEITKTGKRGKVLVKYPTGYEEEYKKRPKVSIIGTERCRCIQYEK